MTVGQSQPKAHGHKHRVRSALNDRLAVDECTGARNCASRLHVHGCFADLDGTRCDDPEDHA